MEKFERRGDKVGPNLSNACNHLHPDAQKRQSDSHMVKHWARDHAKEEEMPHFMINIVGSCRDALSRQISEGVRIARRGANVLKSKSEYTRCKIPRLTIDVEDWERKIQEEVADAQATAEEKYATTTVETILESGSSVTCLMKEKRKLEEDEPTPYNDELRQAKYD